MLQSLLGLQPTNVRVTSVHLDNDLSSVSGPYVQQYSVSLQADNVALFVTLNTDAECEGRFSENGFHMTRLTLEKMIKFYSKDYLSESELINCISVRSYKNNI